LHQKEATTFPDRTKMVHAVKKTRNETSAASVPVLKSRRKWGLMRVKCADRLLFFS
jgi:hypothetical protein